MPRGSGLLAALLTRSSLVAHPWQRVRDKTDSSNSNLFRTFRTQHCRVFVATAAIRGWVRACLSPSCLTCFLLFIALVLSLAAGREAISLRLAVSSTKAADAILPVFRPCTLAWVFRQLLVPALQRNCPRKTPAACKLRGSLRRFSR